MRGFIKVTDFRIDAPRGFIDEFLVLKVADGKNYAQSIKEKLD